EPPRVRSLRDDVPSSLDALVARLLAREPMSRPEDAAAAARELAQIPDAPGLSGPATIRGQALTDSEQRFLCVVLAGRPADAAPLGNACVAVERLGARLDVLADGSLLVSLTAVTAPTDQAPRAARCALALRGILTDVPIVMRVGP